MLSRLLRHFKRPERVVIVTVPQASRFELSLDERRRLRDWLSLPETQLALSIVEAKHPGTNVRVPSVAASQQDAYAAVSFIARIKGWESYRNSLLAVVDTPKKEADLVESFPSTN